MPDTRRIKDSGRIIRGQTFDQQPLTIRDSGILCHVQPCFPLSEADFIKLRSHGNILHRLGEVILIFGITYGLSNLDAFKSLVKGQSGIPNSPTAIWITGVGILLGMGLLIVSHLVSPERRKMIRKIQKHFEDNPGKPEILERGRNEH